MIRPTLLIALLLSLQTSYSSAQPVEPDPLQPGDDNVTEPTAAPVTEPAPVTDPVPAAFEDYEASEQISEDLPVAFPVDI
jgi:hypothetical protein